MINFLANPDFCESTKAIWVFIGNILNIFKIIIPIALIIFGMVDLGKATFAGEEKEIKEAQKLLIKRIIYGVMIFFVVTIITFLFAMVPGTNTSNLCMKCINNPSTCD